MIQRTVDVTSDAELLWLQSELSFFMENVHARSIFVQCYLSRFSAAEAQKTAAMLRKAIPHARIAGMSLYGDPIVGLNTDKMMRFNFCMFEEADVSVFEYDGDRQPLEGSGGIIEDFRSKLEAAADAKGVLILGSGVTFKISRFMDAATKGHEDIPFFGSVANINTADVDDQHPYAFGNSLVGNGIVAVIFSGKTLHFFSESLFSWKPIGKRMPVRTGNPGQIGDSLIRTIDGIPAAQIYKKYLNVDLDAHFISNICEFPIVVERNGYILARVPCGYNERGELNTMGDVRDGEYIRFTYGKSEEILQKTFEASRRMKDFGPDGVFLFACANRAIFLKGRAHEEIDDYRRFARELVYCHGFSELYRYKGQGGVFNSQLVAVGLREGERRESEDDGQALPGVFFGKQPRSPAPPLPADGGRQTAAAGTREQGGPASFQTPIGASIPIADRLATFLESVTEELNKATAAANAASNAKSAFLSNISHEIRSPINAVLGLDEMIMRESADPVIKGYARDIQSSGKSLLSIINDILDFSKIEAGKMEIVNSDYDLRSTITDLTNMVETRARNKGLDFIVKVDEEMPHLLYGDETRIKQCALNILTNAVKYTHSGSVSLIVGCTRSGGSRIALTIRVQDTGIGIKEEDLDKLDKPFERIEVGRNRSIEGTGLGMSIVKGLLSQMGTSLAVKSVYGEGSDFSFSLEQEVRSWERIGSREEARAALMQSAAAYEESFQAPQAKILIIDDTPINLTVAAGLLKATRIQIDTASGGEEALALVRRNKYDILFVDHLMPKMDGLEFVARNASDGGSLNRKTPAVALTANVMNGAQEFYRKAGFCDYLSKPIDPQKFERLIVQHLPKKLLILPGDKDFVQRAKESQGGGRQPAAPGAGEEIFAALFGLHLSEALKNCGSVEVFLQAVKTFHGVLDEKADQIERFAQEGDWKNYTVQVHALKSSARLIGATELSQGARQLEEMGNRALAGDGNAAASIAEYTGFLLSDYRAYREKLAGLCTAGGT